MENEELIRLKMERTREALTEKLETLEKKVSSSVAAVTDTVDSVKETVHEGVETVKDAMDVPAHVERHPWLMLSGSVLCGYVLGNILAGQSEKRAEPKPAPEKKANGDGRPQQTRQAGPTANQNWLGAFLPEMQQLKSLALGVTLGTVREMLTVEVPPHMADHLRDIIDAVTKKAGGEPIPSSDFAAAKSATPQSPEPECKLNV